MKAELDVPEFMTQKSTTTSCKIIKPSVFTIEPAFSDFFNVRFFADTLIKPFETHLKQAFHPYGRSNSAVRTYKPSSPLQSSIVSDNLNEVKKFFTLAD